MRKICVMTAHAVELLTFNQDGVEISLAFICNGTFPGCDFYAEEKMVKHTQIYSWR